MRFHDLAGVPPGLTHDEADHGLTAWQIAGEGLREIYFTIGYGREPLYDYVVAALMSFLGPTIFAGRLVSAFASLILIAAMMAWVDKAFSRSTALMTGAGLALGFWPVMSGRQALRSVLLPTLFVLAVTPILAGIEKCIAKNDCKYRPVLATLFTLLPFHYCRYLPGLDLLYLHPGPRLVDHLSLRCCSSGSLRSAIIVPLLVVANWNYAARHVYGSGTPPALTCRPIPALNTHRTVGRSRSMLHEMGIGDCWQTDEDSLRLFFLEGDTAWRYNIAGRPFLGPLFGMLFVLGLLQALWWLVTPKRNRGNSFGLGFLSIPFLADMSVLLPY